MKKWKAEFIEKGGVKDVRNFPFIIVGNKSDLEDERTVKESKIESWCEKNGKHEYFETSAKDNENVDDAFNRITELAAAQIKEDEL